MNKIQIKAEILATLTALSTSSQPNASLITDLKKIEDKKTVLDVLVKELVHANEQKALLICWLLTELIDKDSLNDDYIENLDIEVKTNINLSSKGSLEQSIKEEIK